MIYDLFQSWLSQLWEPNELTAWAAAGLGLLTILLAAWIVDRLARRYLLRLVDRVAARSSVDWDDIFLEHGVIARAVFILPAGLVWRLAPEALPTDASLLLVVVRDLALSLVVIAGALASDAAIVAVREIYRRRQGSNRIPTGTIVQLARSAVYLVAGVVIVAIVIGRTPLFVLSGFGALTAVLLIVFRDPLLGLVGGFNLTINDMVRIGDWIEMPKYGADGDVLDISLTSVKVQNWDKTISTIPTYSLISDSFRNWRGMSESGGRRIKRAISIDMTSVRFVDQELYEKLQKVDLLRDHLAAKQAELDAYNREHGVDDSSLVNGRRITNLGVFRAYLLAYLRRHPKIRQDMTLIVRQLAPTSEGIPIEIYSFSGDQAWADYERIQSDIFDHVLASIHEFDLRVFQSPGGVDFHRLSALG